MRMTTAFTADCAVDALEGRRQHLVGRDLLLPDQLGEAEPSYCRRPRRS